MHFKDYYEILGVKEDADLKDIKKAYRKIALKLHPDVNSGADADEKFKELAEAYEVLKDPKRRAQYDEMRKYGGNTADGFNPQREWQGQSDGFNGAHEHQDFSDFFNSVFGGGGFHKSGGDRGSTEYSNDFAMKGQDAEIEVPIFLEDTLHITEKTIQYSIPHVLDGQIQHKRKTLKVKIPAGVSDGERIRLKGQAGKGHGDGPNGDLYLHIRLVPHPLFDVSEHDLMITVPLSPWEAALGAEVTIPTLDGKIKLSIKANSQAGQKLRIKGKGLKSKHGKGDLIAILKIVMPEKSDEKSQLLWQQLAQSQDFDPREQWSK
ncbi:DnaJ domain-containing protein [Glaciecola sp. XM2]|jgi:curved DNA-binding protein|uniref:DnaJ C-terminal domain-containing protein n=1 Tax=Glaciecola sp. XM2 TaxID=1914931 RepID=UPI001BDE46CC|nr:DnaJ C-terminal domain-containing protein [Glaciecola sp. XM2]MBT1450069.1 DnaJ domain-containing protein [Glaciecola sp. XM2]